jgi:putative hydrolase of HD superfamily
MDNFRPLILNHSNGGDWQAHNVTAEQIYKRQGKIKLGSEKLFKITEQIIRDHIEKGSLKE